MPARRAEGFGSAHRMRALMPGLSGGLMVSWSQATLARMTEEEREERELYDSMNM